MDKIDELKILIMILACSPSILSFLSENNQKDVNKLYILLLIRIIIVYFSITYNWPIIMCTSINITITTLLLIIYW